MDQSSPIAAALLPRHEEPRRLAFRTAEYDITVARGRPAATVPIFRVGEMTGVVNPKDSRISAREEYERRETLDGSG